METNIPTGIARIFRITREKQTWDILVFDNTPHVYHYYYMLLTQVDSSCNLALLDAIIDEDWKEMTLEEAGYTLDDYDLDRMGQYAVIASEQGRIRFPPAPWEFVIKREQRRLLPYNRRKPTVKGLSHVFHLYVEERLG